VFQYFNAKINGEEKNLEQIELQKKRNFVQDDQARTCTYVVAKGREKKKLDNRKERHTIKKKKKDTTQMDT